MTTIHNQRPAANTRSYALWAANVLLAVLAPAFLCRFTTGNPPAARPSP